VLITTPEIEDMVKHGLAFVRANRCEKAFKNWSDEQVENEFREAIFNKAFFLCSDDFGKVIGVVHGVPNHRNQTMYVWNILTTDSKAIKAFIKLFKILYPNYTLEGDRYGKRVIYPEKFKQKLINATLRK
jgi:hypothetical protein